MNMDNYAQVFIRIKPTNKFSNEVIEILPGAESLNVRVLKEKRKGYINNQVMEWNFR